MYYAINVEENITLPLSLDNREVNKNKLDELIKALGLENRRTHLPNELSGGQQQRTSIGRAMIMNKLLGKHKNSFYIEPPFYCDYGYNIEVGENFYSNHNLIILDGNKVTFGDNVFIAPNCGFYTAGHPLDYKEIKD